MFTQLLLIIFCVLSFRKPRSMVNVLLKFFEPVTDVDELPCAGEVSDGSDDGKDQY